MTDAAITAPEQADASTDLDLIARWKAGDQRAATALVERHADAIARFVASVGARGDVDDLVQDTFVRAFGSLDSFRGESSLRTWLFTIARRLLLDQRRAERRRGGGAAMQVEVHDADVVTEHDALDEVVADETERRMREAVGRLSVTQREVFTLRVAEGLSYREIAEAVDTTEGAARVHYHNAMRAIKEFLDE
jgi:RNA polymerase sigma-70 factor (ECF subfamily)